MRANCHKHIPAGVVTDVDAAGEALGQVKTGAHRGQLEIIKSLVDRGASLEARNGLWRYSSGAGDMSVMNGDPSVEFVPALEALLAAGANIEEADYPTANAAVDELLSRHGAKSR